jgi:hypothetical protein
MGERVRSGLKFKTPPFLAASRIILAIVSAVSFWLAQASFRAAPKVLVGDALTIRQASSITRLRIEFILDEISASAAFMSI